MTGPHNATRRRLLAMICSAPALLPGLARAQSGAAAWPSKPVRVIVPFTPGGAIDVATRTMAQCLAEHFGQPFVVDNRPGAGGTVAMALLAKAPPDGYTLGSNDNGYAIATHAYKTLPYDPLKDLKPLFSFAFYPFLMLVRGDSRFRNLGDVIKEAKQKPGTINFASGGVGGTQHFAMEAFNLYAGTQMTHVPFKGANDTIVALLGGTVDILVVSMTTAGVPDHLKSGKFRALAISGEERWPTAPDIPTFREAGLPGFNGTFNWTGYWAPAGIPADVALTIQDGARQAMKSETMRNFLARANAKDRFLASDEFALMLASAGRDWEKVTQQPGYEKM